MYSEYIQYNNTSLVKSMLPENCKKINSYSKNNNNFGPIPGIHHLPLYTTNNTSPIDYYNIIII